MESDHATAYHQFMMGEVRSENKRLRDELKRRGIEPESVLPQPVAKTKWQNEILHLLSLGLSTPEIARKRNTDRANVSRICRTLASELSLKGTKELRVYARSGVIET